MAGLCDDLCALLAQSVAGLDDGVELFLLGEIKPRDDVADVVLPSYAQLLGNLVAEGKIVHPQALEETVEVVCHMVGILKEIVVHSRVQHEWETGRERIERLFGAFAGKWRKDSVPECDQVVEFASDNSEARQFKRGANRQILLEVDVLQEVWPDGQNAANRGLRW